jgi:hypothetical protein
VSAPKREIKRTTEVVVRGELDINSLYELVDRAVPDAPEDATIELYVRIPDGGDWSSTDLELDLKRTVQFTVKWREVK